MRLPALNWANNVPAMSQVSEFFWNVVTSVVICQQLTDNEVYSEGGNVGYMYVCRELKVELYDLGDDCWEVGWDDVLIWMEFLSKLPNCASKSMSLMAFFCKTSLSWFESI